MAVPRSTSLRAFRTLSQQQSTIPSIRRGLHITGANSAQPVNPSIDRTSLFSSLGVADLKQECQKRSIAFDGSKPEVSILLHIHTAAFTRLSLHRTKLANFFFFKACQPLDQP